jgi:hypothetical protein
VVSFKCTHYTLASPFKEELVSAPARTVIWISTFMKMLAIASMDCMFKSARLILVTLEDIEISSEEL